MGTRNIVTRPGLFAALGGGATGALWPLVMTALDPGLDGVFSPLMFSVSIALGLGLGGAVAVVSHRAMARRVRKLHDVVRDLADNPSAVEILDLESRDVFGDVARALASLREVAQQRSQIDLRDVQDSQRTQAAKDQQREALAHDFEAGVKEAMSGVQKGTQSLQQAARMMGESAESSLTQAHSAIDLSDAATQGVGAVAQAAERMAETVRELSSKMRRSNEMSQQAVDRVSQADAMVDELGQTTARIEEVAGLIVDIASKTNMLALNATIEAARAGDAGKGFAVVAVEVKNLATQTAAATEQIASHVENIRGAGQRARSAMGAVSTAIEEINAIAGDVTEAADQQSSSISEISVNARETADATNQSLVYIRDVGDAIEQTGFAAHEMLATVDDLARQMGTLSQKSDGFIDKVRKG